MADNRITINAEFGQNYKDLGFIGRVGENESREIAFDCADALTQFPGASIVCVIKRACDTKPYSAALTDEGYNRILPLSAVENAAAGQIMIELRAVSNDTILKSAMFSGRIAESLQGEGDRPGNPASDMLNRIDSTLQSATETQKKLLSALDGVDTAVDGANTAAENAQAVADTVQAKLDNGDFVGAKGDKGDPGDVQDVKVAGVSVLTDGVANVPNVICIRDDNSIGVVNPPQSTVWGGLIGISKNDGNLILAQSTPSTINSRGPQFVGGGMLDYAVKAAMCDGKGAAWTENEQKAARERMGVDNPYELIEEITLTEKVTQLNRNAEPNGTAYHFKKMYVSIITPQAEADGVIYSYFNNTLVGLAANSSVSQSPKGGIAQLYAHVANGFLDGYGVGTPNLSTSSSLVRYVTKQSVPLGIAAINSMAILSTVDIPINTNIKIYGVRA